MFDEQASSVWAVSVFFGCFYLGLVEILFRLNCLVLGVLFSSSDEKSTKRGSRKETLSAERVPYVSSQRGWGIFALNAKMLLPIEGYLFPAPVGRSRTTEAGNVKFGFPSVELLGRCVTEMGLSVTDRGDIAESV